MKKKKRICERCKHYKPGECWLEGELLFVAFYNAYLKRGYTEEEANEKVWFRPQVEPFHTCEHFEKKAKRGKG